MYVALVLGVNGTDGANARFESGWRFVEAPTEEHERSAPLSRTHTRRHSSDDRHCLLDFRKL